MNEFSASEYAEYKKRIDERFEALAAERANKNDRIAIYLSVASFLVAFMTMLAVLLKWGQ